MDRRKPTSRTSSWSLDQQPERNRSGSDLLLQIVDLGMAAIVFCSPLIFGGRHPWGQLALVAMCAVVSICWFTRQALIRGNWTRTSATWLLLLAVGLVVSQTLPLPSTWISALSPRMQTLLPTGALVSASDTSQVDLTSISVAPAETRRAAALMFGYFLLFITAVQRLQTREDIERILKWIGFSALLGASFGIVQYFGSNGKYFWFYEYPYVDTSNEVIGTFTNRNHFAHFLLLGLGPLTAFFVCKIAGDAGRKDSSRFNDKATVHLVLLAIAACTLLWTVFLTFSRGGALALFFALLVLGTVYVRSRIIKFSELAVLLALGLVLVVGGLSIYGFDRVAARLDDFGSGSIEEMDRQGGRRKIWSANLAAIQDGWQTGSGAGTHPFIYPAYLKQPSHREFTHAENSYLQLATENGLPGIVLMTAAIGCLVFWLGRAIVRSSSTKAAACAGGVTAALTASLVHALVDFVWYVPACVAITVLLAAVALRLSQLSLAESSSVSAGKSLPSTVWIAICLVAAVGAVLAIMELIGPARAANHWHKFQLASISHKSVRGQKFLDGKNQQEVIQMDLQSTRFMVQELRKVVQADPAHARAHYKLALQSLRLFEIEGTKAQNQMTVAQIRDTALDSKFPTSQELKAWLTRAFGQRSELLYQALYHNRKAIELAPLQGRAYVLLAQLCFLEGRHQQYVDHAFAQALRVTPFDNDVLLSVGIHRLAEGNLEEALSYWSHLFKNPTTHQYQVVDLLAGKIPADVLLRTLRPGPLSLPYLWKRYQLLGVEPDWVAIENHIAQIADDTVDSISSNDQVALSRLRAAIQKHTDRWPEALDSLQAALEIHPNSFSTRYEIGVVAMQLQNWELSDEQFRWCLTRNPDHEGAKKLLSEVGRLRLSQRNGLGARPLSLQ